MPVVPPRPPCGARSVPARTLTSTEKQYRVSVVKHYSRSSQLTSHHEGRRFMPIAGGTGVARFTVEFEIANNDDLVQERLGLLASDRVRRQTIRGVVDSGAAKLVLPR